MLRIIYIVFRNLFHLYLIPLMRYVAAHPQKYPEQRRYQIVRKVSHLVTRAGHIHARYYGIENIPASGGYILCSNHQGKFDALAIVNGHQQPCSLVMDYERSQMYVVNEVMAMLQGKRLKRDDVRQAMSIILEMTDELKQGRKFIIFPEGGYLADKQNTLFPFKPGSFKSVLKSKSQIVPVALIDTYKAFSTNSLRRVYVEVHYLPPITYEEIKDMKTPQIANMVRMRIADKISQVFDVPVEELLVDDLDPDVSLI